MEKIKVLHDTLGQTMTIWFDDPAKEEICEETTEEVVIMKDNKGSIIGLELLHYSPKGNQQGLSVETIIHSSMETSA